MNKIKFVKLCIFEGDINLNNCGFIVDKNFDGIACGLIQDNVVCTY
jgi:hypothetical protein